MNIPSNPADRKKIEQALQEISNSLTRSEAERDLVRDIIKTTCDQFELDKKIFRRMARVYHRRNYSEEVAEHEQFETLYETITASPQRVSTRHIGAEGSEGGELD
jgi:hypothetical protein